jgi:quercetin dioxygenase-like cupin family protein
LSEIPEERVKDKLFRKMIVGRRIMLTQIILKKGCHVVSHRHESEQITFVVEGLLEFTLPCGKVRVGKGQVLVIPSNLEHSAVALEGTLEFDIFSPIREDWLRGKDHYLRKG